MNKTTEPKDPLTIAHDGIVEMRALLETAITALDGAGGVRHITDSLAYAKNHLDDADERAMEQNRQDYDRREAAVSTLMRTFKDTGNTAAAELFKAFCDDLEIEVLESTVTVFDWSEAAE